MGTSTAFGGGKNSNPLIPSWLDDNPNSQPADGAAPAQGGDTPTLQPVVPEIVPVLPTDNRFSTARRNFTAFTNSGGSDRAALGRAIASYVSKTAGGSKQAAKRMKAERTASATLGNILSMASVNGIQAVIKSLNLESLANRPISEIYAALVDVICPTGGDLDDSIARDAYIEAIGEVAEMGLTDLEQPSVDTIATIMECFISNAIKDRIMNAIATKIVALPENVCAVQNIERQLKDFIRGAVSDAIAQNGKVFPADKMSKTIDSLYEHSYTVLEALAEQEIGQ
jgi:hypothetical protein